MIEVSEIVKMKKIWILFVLLLAACQHKNVHTSSAKKEEVFQNTTAGFERYILRAQPIQKTALGEDLNWGGLSGLRFIQREPTGDLLFWAITDRGPNGIEIKKEGTAYREFLVTDFHPSIVKLRTNKAEKSVEVIESLPLKNSTGEFMTGLPPKNSKDTKFKYEVALSGHQPTVTQPTLGIDSESVAVDEKNHFWVGEEYLPSILEFDEQGTLITHVQPADQPKTKLGKNQIPYEYRLRKTNRGFEALAYFQDRIYFMTQSPLGFETKSKYIRIGVFNTKSRLYEAEYLYPLETEKVDKIGDMQMISAKSFLVIEQNGEVGPQSVHNVYRVDFSKASNVLKLKLSRPPELTSDRAFPRGFQAAQKTLALDLVKQGYSDYEKVEGLTIIDKDTIAVINDNDFGVEGQHIELRPTVLGIFKIKN